MKKRNGFVVAYRLIGLVRPLTGYMVLAVLMGVIGNLMATFITILAGYGVVNMERGAAGIFAVMILFALLRAGFRYGEQACNHFIAFRILALLRDKVFKALRQLCPAKLEGRDRGDLISLITSDIELLEVFYAHTISPIAIYVIFTAVMCAFLGAIHPAFAAIALAAYLCVGIAIPLVVSKCSGDNGADFRGRSGELSSFVLESLRGLDETIQYGCGEARLRQMSRQSEGLSAVEDKMKRVASANGAVTGAVILLFDLAMLFCGTALFLSGKMDFSGVLIAELAILSSFGPSVALANLGSTLQNTIAAGNRVLDILEEEPQTREIAGREEIAYEGAEAEHVTFSYEKEEILSDFSLELPKNGIVGILGKSGSGKSTFLKLLMRFWRVEQGTIAVSGTNLEKVNTRNLRDMESFMTQDTHLFHDTIRENLKIARLDATEEELQEACKKASVHDFIMSLPQGYDTQVGELGDTLSGGERQRIGLARAFLHNAPLVLLDEPTSNLDSLNEAIILKSLHEERKDKTIVLVSHRSSTMKICDEVYSVENGRVS